MCGIFGYVGKDCNAAEIVLSGLKSLEYRGYDSWGVAVVSESRIYVKKKAGKIGDAVVSGLPASGFGFGHTRWATHGGVTDLNSHPHLDCSSSIAVIHNGIIENYEEIKKKLQSLGHKFISETDTEVFAHLVEEYSLKSNFPEAVGNAFREVAGLNAFIVLNAKSPEFFVIRNGSPLVIGFGQDGNFLASDPVAFLPHTKKVHFLSDNQLARVYSDKVEITDQKTRRKVVPKIVNLKWNIKEAEKGEFAHFMLKEIFEQPKVMATIVHSSSLAITKLAELVRKSFGTYLIGCGSASYACLSGSYLFSKIAKRHVNWCVGSEFNYQLDFLTPKSLVIALSQSGETMDILEAVRKARESRAKIIAIVNVLGSTLHREADFSIPINAGPEKAVASTKSFTGKLAILLLLAYALDGKLEKGERIIKLAITCARELLEKDKIDSLIKIAKMISHKEHLYVVGRGLSYPASLETAMKIKEISYIHAEGLPAGELKHGPLALIEKGTPCLVFLPDDETYGANLSGAMELKARGGIIIGVSFKSHEIFDHFIKVSDAKEATIIPNVIVGQLLAYFLALERGLDPDMPRNLAKSVTVK